ncbi:MAG TPA: glycosyltransferase family 9 protein [Planctomycetota bacterium]|nr:glycosyltransferase family 9 protein [Planctomycetota bacterium]
MSAEERILLIRLSHLGDVVHALPVFHALRVAHPHARIAWAIEPEFAPLLAGLPGLERTVRFGRREGPRAWLELAAEIARFAPTWVVDAQGNLKSAAASLCAPSARRSGMHPRDWRERAGARVLHDCAAPVARDPAHALDRMLALAQHVGATEAWPSFELGLVADEHERGRTALEAALGRAPLPGDVWLALSSAEDVRSWPRAQWAQLARLLSRAGRRVLLVSGPREEELGHHVARELSGEPDVRSWIGQRGLRELAAALALAARSGMRYVGVDSGPLHLAAACGMRVVVLEGPQSHLRTGPWPPPGRVGGELRHAVVRSGEALACAPCFRRTCSHREGPVCMSRLGPERVLSALADASLA